jgi:glutamate racemase
LDKRPIGIFDSGVGGLTVFKEIIKQAPDETYIYFGDTARFPYGTKNLEDVKKYAVTITRFLLKKDIKLLVVACNTASAAALEVLKQNFPIPVIGVIEPGARAASFATVTKKVGVIATNSTIASGIYEKELKKIDPQLSVFSVAASPLVDLIEKGVLGGADLRDKICSHIASLANVNIDTLILGCTHFPLIEAEIEYCCRLYFKTTLDFDIISSAYETAKDVKEILEKNGLKNSPENNPTKFFLETGDESKFLEIGKLFLGDEIKEVKKVCLDM